MPLKLPPRLKMEVKTMLLIYTFLLGFFYLLLLTPAPPLSISLSHLMRRSDGEDTLPFFFFFPVVIVVLNEHMWHIWV